MALRPRRCPRAGSPVGPTGRRGAAAFVLGTLCRRALGRGGQSTALGAPALWTAWEGAVPTLGRASVAALPRKRKMQPTPNLLARASWDTMHAVIRSAACSLLGHPFPTQCGLGTSTATRAPHPTLTCMLRVGLAAPASSGQTEPVKYIEAGLCRSTWDRVSPALPNAYVYAPRKSH